MSKGVGFNRNIYLSWLDASAALCAEIGDLLTLRERLTAVVAARIADPDNQRKAVDILINIWVKSGEASPALRARAVRQYQEATVATDRVWLHYGLTLLYYGFFRDVVTSIGQLSRTQDALTSALVKQRIVASRGQLGSLDKAVERVVFSLRDWGLLAPTGKAHEFAARPQATGASSEDLQAWLLACALYAHPGEELPFPDLVHLPALFPFRFTLSVDALRTQPWFAVQRQGAAWDMVRLAPLA